MCSQGLLSLQVVARRLDAPLSQDADATRPLSRPIASRYLLGLTMPMSPICFPLVIRHDYSTCPMLRMIPQGGRKWHVVTLISFGPAFACEGAATTSAALRKVCHEQQSLL